LLCMYFLFLAISFGVIDLKEDKMLKDARAA